ncbi:MAG: hypothetical protein QOE45_928 [Frankiaceae bacterium]|nr:hypothetical protein [Frankiaceae bacterium]
MTRRDFATDELALAAAAIARTEDDLLLDFGVALAGPGAARDGDVDDLRGRANNWFDRNRDELKNRLCGHPELERLTDTAIDTAAVADLVAALTGKTAAYTVAAIILKRGLNWLCR